MKFLLLLLLLTSWTHLGSDAPICNTDTRVVISGHLLNVNGSISVGADAYFIKAYSSRDLNTCLEDCCIGKFGPCSVAAYRNVSVEATCLHFYCEPLSSCQFFPMSSADCFTFPRSTVSTRKTVFSQVVTPISTVFNLLKDHERSVTARKGVENTQLTRKGEFKNDLISKEELNFKNDNTTVKPRKGVSVFTDVETTPLSDISVIKPRKGVETQDDFGIQDSKSKIKPRKGVEPFLRTSVSITPLTNIHSSSSSSSVETVTTVYHNFLHNKDELLSILKNVFVDDVNVIDSFTQVPDITTSQLSTSELQKPSTFTVSKIIFTSPDYSSVIIPTAVSSSYLTTTLTVPQSTHISAKSEDFQSTLIHESFTSSSDLYSSLSYDQHTSQPSSIQTMSTPAISVKSVLSNPSPSTHRLILSSSTVLKNNFPSSSKLLVEMFSANTQIIPSQKEIEESNRRYESSMHLVFALVFGLLVLFGVLGTVAKRVYDGWVRRHYHRMDFLIDGMYDGYT